MANLNEWWSTWAPYWSHMEDRHFGTSTTLRYLQEFKDPVLVVGAGTGLVVGLLKDRGYKVDGIDLDPQMIRIAHEKRSLDIIQADAGDLPFEQESYRTVIIPSGVVDYADDQDTVERIFREALRVLEPGGSLFAGFYQMPAIVEKVNRRIGVVGDGRHHMKRLFDIMMTVKDNPLKCVPKIVKWTGRSYLSTFLYWTRLGLFLPRELNDDRRKIETVLALAEEDGIPVEDMVACVPESLPYRTEEEVRDLLDGIGMGRAYIDREYDCLVVRSRKSTIAGVSGMEGDGTDAPIEPFVRTEGLCKRYDKADVNAVDMVSLTIGKGEIFGILGPNGAGKTTLLSMLSGLMAPDSGSIVFPNAVDTDDIREIIGFVPQNLALYPRLTGRENLEFFGGLYRVTGSRLQGRIGTLLDLVGLADRADEPINRYSTGMMRRLNMAVGLIHEPRLLLLDEPTVGIDPQSRNCLFDAILGLRDDKVTIFYTTHYMEEASRLCDRVAIMDQGRILLQGEPAGLVREHGLFRIEFKVGELEGGFVERVTGMDRVFSASVSGGVFSVLTRTDQERMGLIEEIGRMAEEAGATLTLRRMLDPDLESLFLDITGRRLKDGVEG